MQELLSQIVNHKSYSIDVQFSIRAIDVFCIQRISIRHTLYCPKRPLSLECNIQRGLNFYRENWPYMTSQSVCTVQQMSACIFQRRFRAPDIVPLVIAAAHLRFGNVLRSARDEDAAEEEEESHGRRLLPGRKQARRGPQRRRL